MDKVAAGGRLFSEEIARKRAPLLLSMSIAIPRKHFSHLSPGAGKINPSEASTPRHPVHVHKNLPVAPNLSQVNLARTFPPYFFKINFNTAFQSAPSLITSLLLSGIRTMNFIRIPHIPYMLHAPPISSFFT